MRRSIRPRTAGREPPEGSLACLQLPRSVGCRDPIERQDAKIGPPTESDLCWVGSASADAGLPSEGGLNADASAEADPTNDRFTSTSAWLFLGVLASWRSTLL